MGSATVNALALIIGIVIGYFVKLLLAKKERSYKYFTAALDQKLKAHQEAYNLAWELPAAAHNSKDDHSHTQKCEAWYRENCLYLERQAREAFFRAYRTADDYYLDLDQWRATKKAKELRQHWDIIVSAIRIIEQCVTLPLSDTEEIDLGYDYKGEIEKK